MTAPIEKKRIVCIGGGTGTFVVLRGLKKDAHHLTAIVSMSDSGGSNSRIRDEFGLLPTSDIRQCLVALSDENGGVGLLRQLFMYRFEKGTGIAGMTFGNLFMAALTDIVGSQEEAIRKTGKVLRIKGSIIPVTLTPTNLYATYENGMTVTEEHLIDEPEHDGRIHITKVFLKPDAPANPEAIKAIKHADLIIIGPGDIYTSILPNFLVQDIATAISTSKAIKVYILNLMTKYGQTYGYTAKDHLKTLEAYIGKAIHDVIINSAVLPKEALDIYEKNHELPVVNDLDPNAYYHIQSAPLISDTMIQKSASDSLVRSLIRHDSDKLAEALISLLAKETS